MAEKEVKLKGLVDGAIHDLFPKTNANRVMVDENTTLTEKLEELAKSGGGNCPIKPFPITKGVQPNYDLVVLYELEDNTFYYLDKNSHDKPVYFSANGQHILAGASYDYIYFNVRYASESIDGSLRFGNQSIWYRADSNGKMIGTVNKMSNYLPIRNDNPYTPTGDYYPATKKYVDDTTASVVADALANLEVGDVSLIKPFPTSETEYYTFVNVAELEDGTFYACPKTDKAKMFRVEYGNSTSVSVPIDAGSAGEIYYHRSYPGGTTIPSLFYGFLMGQSSTIEYSVYSSGEHRIERKDYDNYLPKNRLYDENYSYTPTHDYNPATKKYVDDAIDSIKIPEIPEIPELVQGNWNQNDPTADDYIKNRTHWVEGNGANTLEWDGSTDGLALLSPDGETTLYKVTDFFVGKDDLVGGTVTISGAMDITISSEMVQGEAGDGFELYMVGYNGTTLLLTANQDITMEGLTIEKGTYFLSMGAAGYVSKVTLLTPAFGEEIVHKIDPKFISIGGYGYDNSEVLFDQTVELAEMEEGITAYMGTFPKLLENKTYKVTYNGVSYDCVPFDPADFGLPLALGNAGPMGGNDTGEPFLMQVMDEDGDGVIDFMFVSLNGDTSATVKIEVSEIHTIDPKFLPGKVVYTYDESTDTVTDVNGNEVTVEQARKDAFNVAFFDGWFHWLPVGIDVTSGGCVVFAIWMNGNYTEVVIGDRPN